MEKFHRRQTITVALPTESEASAIRPLFDEAPGARPFTAEEHRRLLEAFRAMQRGEVAS